MVSVSSIHVEENSGVVITNSSLSVRDQDTPENELLFRIIRVPSYGERQPRCGLLPRGGADAFSLTEVDGMNTQPTRGQS